MAWTGERIHGIVENQREFFLSGGTLPVPRRIGALKALRDAVRRNGPALEEALGSDLGRHPAEAYFCDIGPTLMELDETIRGLKKWVRPERHFSGLACFPGLFTRVYKMPYGVTLIISPFNFPVLLSLGVLAASLAGGNTAVIKASSKSAACTEALKKLVAETFPENYVTVVDGGHDAADLCLAERFDKIFYTGSPKVATHVLEAAAKHLTPVALELGGETGNWCIVRRDADLRDAARKIAFFKMLNSGQVCINVNQVAVAEEVAEDFLRELKAAFASRIGEDALRSPEYPRLITRKAWDACAEEAERYRDRIVFGGTGDPETCRYAPTVIYPVGAEEEIARHELFCPLLPVVPFPDREADRLLDTIARREHGLALYLFTRDRKWANKVMSTAQYGGGCVNEVCLHMMAKGVPFNGTGHSGMGAYHGEWGFREFTHPSTVLAGSTRFNLSLREHPYTQRKERLLRAFVK